MSVSLALSLSLMRAVNMQRLAAVFAKVRVSSRGETHVTRQRYRAPPVRPTMHVQATFRPLTHRSTFPQQVRHQPLSNV